MMKSFFITGTDTGVGKTTVTVSLLKLLASKGLTTAGMKPIASGCETKQNKLNNEDALMLQQAMTMQLEYDLINPIALEPPIAPHLAAKEVGMSLSVALLSEQTKPLLALNADILLIEGAGGWMVPLNDKETYADYVVEQKFPVILVVGMRLGCINHALLTYHMIVHRQLEVIGWVANCMEPSMAYLHENIQTLETMLPIPCIGVLPHSSDGSTYDCSSFDLDNSHFNF